MDLPPMPEPGRRAAPTMLTLVLLPVLFVVAVVAAVLILRNIEAADIPPPPRPVAASPVVPDPECVAALDLAEAIVSGPLADALGAAAVAVTDGADDATVARLDAADRRLSDLMPLYRQAAAACRGDL